MACMVKKEKLDIVSKCFPFVERPRHRWEGSIRMDLWEIGWEGVGWIHLT
jgi:hypothetical protein